MLETTDVNRCAGAYVREKFPNSAQGFCKPKNAPRSGIFGGVCYLRTAQTAQFRATEIILGASRHRNDVPFVREFCWGCTFGRYDPRIEGNPGVKNTV